MEIRSSHCTHRFLLSTIWLRRSRVVLAYFSISACSFRRRPTVLKSCNCPFVFRWQRLLPLRPSMPYQRTSASGGLALTARAPSSLRATAAVDKSATVKCSTTSKISCSGAGRNWSCAETGGYSSVATSGHLQCATAAVVPAGQDQSGHSRHKSEHKRSAITIGFISGNSSTRTKTGRRKVAQFQRNAHHDSGHVSLVRSSRSRQAGSD